MMFRHGLRVSEAVTTKIEDGLSVEHPIPGDELRAIKRYLKERNSRLPWLFLSERGQMMTRQTVSYMISTVATRAKLPHVHLDKAGA